MSAEGDPEALAVLAALLKKPTATVSTAQVFVRSLAMLGGFLARKGDGESGWQTIFIGYLRV